MSTVNDQELRHRINAAKLNTSMTTFNESRSRKSHLELFPLEKIIEQEKEYVVWSKLKLMIVTLLVVTLSTVCLGTKDVRSVLGLSICSARYWALYIIFVLFCILMIKLCIDCVFKEHRTKILYGYNFNRHDIKWGRYNVNLLVTAAMLCGISSSITGLGGGLIFAPLLLALNLHPSVSTSTATLFNFFSSLSNTIFAVLSNQVYYDYAIWLLFWTSAGTVLGLFFVKDLIEKTNKTSIVVFVLVVVLLIAVFITTINDIQEIEVDIRNPSAAFTWGSFCHK